MSGRGEGETLPSADAGKQRVVVVTGGAAGIGAAIAEELGRSGAFVVTLDPMVTVDGAAPLADSGPTTADRIVEAGGTARASNASVTDPEAVPALFAGLVEEFGSLDAVVNVAGISRPTEFASGTEEDWAAVLSVHLDGYLNVLGAALPIMTKAGHGRILGVTSGSGWRPANTGAYGCAKRAVAALTWQIGQLTPPGVTVNALSPIAATRMVTGAPSRPAAGGTPPGPDTRTGGVNLGAMPPPENLGPVGAYLASEEFSWCRGQVIFSGGSELAWLTQPQLLEVCRTSDALSLSHVFETVLPIAFTPAETGQATNGGSNPRFGPVFGEEPSGATAGQIQTCLVVTDDPAWGAIVGEAMAARGVKCLGVGAWAGEQPVSGELPAGFEGASAQIARAAEASGPIDAVVLALVGGRRGTGATPTGQDAWRQILDEHAGLTDQIRTDAGWVRAVADYSSHANRPVRVVTLTDATTAGGRSRAQAAAQLARAGHTATSDRVDAFAVSVETAADAERRTVAELAAHLLCSSDTAPLAGAELVVESGWFGLRSHPRPSTTISFGGPAVPAWLDGTLKSIITGSSN